MAKDKNKVPCYDEDTAQNPDAKPRMVERSYFNVDTSQAKHKNAKPVTLKGGAAEEVEEDVTPPEDLEGDVQELAAMAEGAEDLHLEAEGKKPAPVKAAKKKAAKKKGAAPAKKKAAKKK